MNTTKRNSAVFIAIALLGLSNIANAQTNVGGNISSNTIWTLSGSPYIVTGNNIIVNNGVTLSIDAGVTVKFDLTMSMQIDGTLRAIGTAASPIKFTSNVASPQPGDWGFILFNSNSSPYNFSAGTGSILQYCTIEYTGGVTVSNNAALRLNNAAPYINNCTIRYNTKPGIIASFYTKTLRVDSCTIQNSTTGIACYGASTTATAILNTCTITNNTSNGYYGDNFNNRIKNCTISNNNMGGIFINTYSPINLIDSISNNTITGNSSYGISYFSSSTSGNNSNCTISNNTITSNLGYGISYSSSAYQYNSSTCTISNNTITGNSDYGISYSSSASTNNSSNSSTCTINNNTITGNSNYGISYSSSTTTDISSICTISNNTITSNLGYGISYSSSSSSSSSSSYAYTDISSTCTISNNTITDNSGYGISYSSSSSYGNNFSTCILSNNTITGNSGYGISYSSSTSYSNSSNSSTCTISSNRINNNQGSGIYVTKCKTININKNKIVNNKSTQGAGIYIATTSSGVSSNITKNIIANNKATQEGGGVYMNIPYDISNVFTNNSLINNYAPNSSAFWYKGTGVLQANKNTIVWNKATGAAPTRAVYIGAYPQSTNMTLNNNNIYNSNCNSNSPFYELWFAGANSDSINASNTYWNQSTLTAVNNVIYDYLDNSNLGKVNANPLLTSPDTSAPVTLVQNVIKTQAGSNVQLTWSANWETDVVGYKIYWGNPTGYSFSNVVDVGNVTSYMLNNVSTTDTIEITAYDINAIGTDDQVNGNESWFNGVVFVPTVTANGATTFCQGGSVDLISNSTSGNTWSNNDTTQTITVITSGNYSVTIADGNGCSATSSPTAVTVDPLPTAAITPSGSTTFCQGDSVTLSASSANAYSWNNNATTQSIIVSTTGSYSVTITDGNGCSATSSATAVTVDSLPIIPTITASGTVLTSSSATNNQWYLNGTIINGATSQTYTVTQNGNYTVLVTDGNGCSAASAPYNFTATGMGDLTVNNAIFIFPNPSNGMLNVECLISNGNISTIEIYNILGEKVYSTTNLKQQTKNEIDLSSHPDGMYFLNISTTNESFNQKLIIQK